MGVFKVVAIITTFVVLVSYLVNKDFIEGGAHQITSFTKSFVLENLSSRFDKHSGNTSCHSDTSLVPERNNWKTAKGYVHVETCRIDGKTCNSTMLETLLNKGLKWAENSIDKYPYRDTSTIAFSHDDDWQLCISYDLTLNWNSFNEYKLKAGNLECPKSFCNGGNFAEFPYDELI